MQESLTLVSSVSFAQILSFSGCFVSNKEKGGLVTLLAEAHKEDSLCVERLKGAAELSPPQD